MVQNSPGFRPLLLTLAFCTFYGAAEAQTTATLTITTDGSVSGAVGVQGPNGNVCNPNPGGGPGGGTCVFTYPVNTSLRMSANSPSTPGAFHDGTGDTAACPLNKSTCNFTLNTNSTIIATFGGFGPYPSLTINLLGDGKGNVGTDNNQCQNFELGATACTTFYVAGSDVTLQGRSMPGNIFEKFSGGTVDAVHCGAPSLPSDPCTFTLSSDSTLDATFSALASVAIEPNATSINVGNSAFFSARATFTNGMTRFSFNGNTPWQGHTPMDVERFSLAAAVVGDRLYAIGGVDGFCPEDSVCPFSPLNTVEIFNPQVTAFAEFEQAWTAKASMLTPRGSLAAAVVNGKIYAIGGYTLGGDDVASMEFYDPFTNEWSVRASMSAPRAEIAAAVINNTIYVVGGSSSDGDPAIPLKVEAYDAPSNTWTTKAPMLAARSFPAAAAVDGTLYVIGGDGTGSVEAYDAGSDTWSMRASMPSGGGSHRAVALNGLIYAIGGSPVAVKVYNPALDSWATLTSSMPLPVNGQFALAAFDGRLFAAGGNTAPVDGNIAVGTLSANRPPEATWWSNNSAVGRVNEFNSGGVHGEAVGTATISARLVGIDSGAQSATLTVTAGGGGGGGGGSTIFVNGPQQAFAQVGQANWGCVSFSQNAPGPWTMRVNYGEPGGVAEVVQYQADPPAGTCSSPDGISKGVFFFNHAYSSPDVFHVVVTVENDETHAIGTHEFDVQVQENNGGGGDEDCAPVIVDIAVLGIVPFDKVDVSVFDRLTGAHLFSGDVPLGFSDDGNLPAGQYRITFSVPAGYRVKPSTFIIDAVCGEPIYLNATVQAKKKEKKEKEEKKK